MSRRIFVLLAAVVFAAGWYSHQIFIVQDGDNYTRLTKIARESSTKYSFTNPLLFIENSGVVFQELDPLKRRVESYIHQAESNGRAEDVSVYFRDLNTTRWTGVQEDKLYHPASMYKLILLIAYLRAAERDPAILAERLYYGGEDDDSQFYKAEHELEKGNYYSVQELLVDMIVKSGNDSTAALFDRIDKSELARVYQDLEISAPGEDREELVSAKIYSRLFRILYSSTYLSSDLSEQILHLLSQVEFDEGLKKSLPQGMNVAHKFGERTGASPGGAERELHDCGIIYYPTRPYFLCVMTKGQDFEELQKVVADISEIAYEYWNSL